MKMNINVPVEKNLWIIISIIVLSCGTGRQNPEPVKEYNRNQFFIVNYEEILDQPTEVKLSEIANDVCYVRLETADNCLLHTYADFFFTDDFIFVDNVYYILQFTRDGKFIKQIGKQGRGPGEIGIIRMLSVIDSEKLLIAQTNWARKLYYFNYDGEFLKSLTVPDVRSIRILPDHRQLFYDTPVWGMEKYVFLLRNIDGDTLSVVNNHYKWENQIGYSSSVGYHLFTPFYETAGTTSMKYMYNDTVYHIMNDSIIQEYLLNMGKYKLPDENRIEVSGGGFELFKEKSKGYRFAVSMEANEKIYIASEEYSDSKEQHQWNMIYDRRSGAGKLVVDSQGYPGKLINDIDGGSDFWPRGKVNDSTLYVPILPHQITGKKNSEKFAKNEAMNYQGKRQFLEMIGSLDENDNPVLMIVKLK